MKHDVSHTHTHINCIQMLSVLQLRLKGSSMQALWFGLLPLCLHEEVLDAVQISCSGCIGGRRTSVIIDLVYCGERGVAAVAQRCKAAGFLLLMALY